MLDLWQTITRECDGDGRSPEPASCPSVGSVGSSSLPCRGTSVGSRGVKDSS